MWSITVLSAILTLQLCEANAIKSKLENVNGADELYFYHPHPRQPRSSVNVTVSDEKDLNESMTTALPFSNIKITDQKYSQNTSGEYKHE